MSVNSFHLVPLPPFRLDLTAWTLRRRPDNAVDRWDGTAYRRVLPLIAGPVEVVVTQVGPVKAPKLQVAVKGQPLRSQVKAEVSLALRRLLGLNLDVEAFYRFAARQRRLRPPGRTGWSLSRRRGSGCRATRECSGAVVGPRARSCSRGRAPACRTDRRTAPSLAGPSHPSRHRTEFG